MTHSKLYLILLLVIASISCKKDFQVPESIPSYVLPTTEKEIKKVNTIKEVGSILQQVYNNSKAYYEVNAAIYSEYYEDETVLLRDLLFPEASPLYQTLKFKNFKADAGTFKKEFFEILNKGNYPMLKEQIYGKSMEIISSTSETQSAVPTAVLDTTTEIFTKANGVNIYFPYSENFFGTFNASYFDNINTIPLGPKATIVSADREADYGPGQEPYICGTRDNMRLCYSTVNVNDNYAELRATHIVGVGAEIRPTILPDPTPPPGTPINRVYHGWSKLPVQLDRLISFTSNGGGSDMKVCRISGYLQMQDQQITNFAGDKVTVTHTRKDIKKKRWRRFYGVWDPNWIEGNLEQILAVYEEDTKGTKTFNGSLTTTVTLTPVGGIPGGSAVRVLAFNVVTTTQDEIILQRKQDRYSYFRDALNNQGWGFMVETDDFLPPGVDWPIFDGGTNWAFTWPYRTF